jgi:hypothetical protein
MIPQDFLEALPADGISPELADADDIFGCLIGSWDLEAVLYGQQGEVQKSRGELHVCWVLEGRAIQDLFIFPRRADRHSGLPAEGDRYATTIRTYDRSLKAWLVTFINPAADETSAQLLARRQGNGIAMEGKLKDGTPIRWRYVEITPTSFHYRAEKSSPEGNSWRLYLELFGTRIGATD